ncbi:TIR domain-containing protein [Candidatus Nitrospira neomarina]|uniref:TIR domain-containing protein n=1 Tax=Candidatus Nitrospira neomarina TaxID=3020899 RepID=A0AA96GHX6_9BACT|nr:TIR domain-containing protein [Candidatus Nitrospira neomarina]WNM60485.1 TIR domain-containing protein [Candidatus Nitrospira neomarina]
MVRTIKIFVSYSHKDAGYLEDNSLFGFLKGLERDQVVFCTDRQILLGELWDEVVKTNIQQSDMALVLVSQSFLDSPYCQDVEIQGFLQRTTHLIPVILSACEWRRHAWLASRQFLPAGDQTVEEHFQDPGRRKRLFLEIREHMRQLVTKIRQNVPNPTSPQTKSVQGVAQIQSPGNRFSGKAKIAFCDGLGDDWKRLADYLHIRPADQARFERGDEGRGIWVWLENRQRLPELLPALAAIERADLADRLGAK